MAAKPFITRLLSKSPIGAIQKHLETCADCAEHLAPYLKAAFAGDWKKAKQESAQVEKLENAADDLKKQIRLGLHRSLLMQVSRDDLLELVHQQDKIANITRDITGLILGRQMQFPPLLHEPLTRFAVASLKTVEQLGKASEEISQLAGAGFARQKARDMETRIHAINDAEAESDKIQVAVRRQLFSLEAELNPLDAMFMYRCIDLIGDLADVAESAGHRMLLLIAR